jgi:hypothetical protein
VSLRPAWSKSEFQNSQGYTEKSRLEKPKKKKKKKTNPKKEEEQPALVLSKSNNYS